MYAVKEKICLCREQISLLMVGKLSSDCINAVFFSLFCFVFAFLCLFCLFLFTFCFALFRFLFCFGPFYLRFFEGNSKESSGNDLIRLGLNYINFLILILQIIPFPDIYGLKAPE